MALIRFIIAIPETRNIGFLKINNRESGKKYVKIYTKLYIKEYFLYWFRPRSIAAKILTITDAATAIPIILMYSS